MKSLIALIALVVSTSALAAPTKRGPKSRRYAIGEVTVDVGVSAEDRKKLEDNIWPTVALLVGEYGELVDNAQVQKVLADHPELRSCNDDKCNLKLGDLLKVHRLLTIKVDRSTEGQGWKWNVRILNFAVDAAEVVGTTVVPCVQCSADDLLHDLSNSFGPVFKNDAPKALCKLSVASLPPGGSVAIDTIELGEAPFEHSITAGRHTIVVQHERFAKGQAEVDCKPGGGMDITFTLDEKQTTSAAKAVEAPPIEIQAPQHSVALKAAGGVLIGLGLAGIAAGGALVGIDNQPTCNLSGPVRRCANRYDTATGGAILLAGGLLAVVGGVIALVVDSRRSHAITPAASVSPSSAYLGLTGSF